MLRTVFTAFTLLTLAAGPVAAQDRVTVVLRDGERVTGMFEDRVTDHFYVRVSQNDQRRLPIAQVAVIDIGGDGQNLPQAEVALARGANHVLVPRGSGPVSGRFMDVDGGPGSEKPGQPRTIYFRTTSGEERRLPMAEVARLYLAPVPGPADPTVTAPIELTAAGATTVQVPATSDWVSTGVTVRRGDRVIFEVQGEVGLSADAADVASPDGSLTGRRAANAPMPEVLAGALVARVGMLPAFAIGSQSTALVMPGDGLLMLRVNDDVVTDNRGQFTVRLRRQ